MPGSRKEEKPPRPDFPPPPMHGQQQQQQQQTAPQTAQDLQQNDSMQGIQVTSRLCVKNIPKDMTVPKLKEHFAAKGEVTDVKIMRTR